MLKYITTTVAVHACDLCGEVVERRQVDGSPHEWGSGSTYQRKAQEVPSSMVVVQAANGFKMSCCADCADLLAPYHHPGMFDPNEL